jgi:hypothetical protein
MYFGVTLRRVLDVECAPYRSSHPLDGQGRPIWLEENK